MFRILRVLGLVVLGLIVAVIVVTWFGRPAPETRGLWRTEGYGLVVRITPFYTRLYEVSEVGCLATETFPSHRGLLSRVEGIRFTTEDGKLAVYADGLYHSITANRITSLPDQCATDQPTDPTAVVSSFAQHFAEHYPFFELHDIDWPQRTTDALRAVTANTTDADLWEVLQTMLSGMDDGHVYIYDGTTGYSPSVPTAWEDSFDSANAIAAGLAIDGLTKVPDSELAYGWLPGNVGYIRLTGMDQLNATGRVQQAAHATMQEAAAALQDAKAIIIDNRFNPGGSDDISLAYAASFTATELRAFDKRIVTRNGLSDPLPAFVDPLGGIVLTQPIYLLNSRSTASAAEIFTFALGELPQVQIRGERSSGGLSDILDRQLPNGWQIGLSHQIYRSNAGDVFENVGYPPDIETDFDADGFTKGQDTLVETVLTELR